MPLYKGDLGRLAHNELQNLEVQQVRGPSGAMLVGLFVSVKGGRLVAGALPPYKARELGELLLRIAADAEKTKSA